MLLPQFWCIIINDSLFLMPLNLGSTYNYPITLANVLTSYNFNLLGNKK